MTLASLELVPHAVNAPGSTRREKAAATRDRILRAAIEVFTEAGYGGTRMTDIASRAGVAVQTVYFTFHTKGELLQACFDKAVLGPERLPPPEQAFYAELMAARSGRAAVAAFVEGNTAINERAAAIKAVAESVPHEPDAAEVVERSEKLRRRGLGEVVTLLSERFGLRAGLDVATGTDILLVLSAPGTYLTLIGYGWSRDRYVAWLTDALARELLARPGASNERPLRGARPARRSSTR
jgi:AcrR family transcriptional regulator